MDYTRVALDKIAQAQTPGYGMDFIGGLDPLGVYTADNATAAGVRGESQAQHDMRRRIATTGGLIGGATLVPGAIGGVIGAARGAAQGHGIGGRLMGAAKGFGTGALKPFKQIKQGLKTKSLLKELESGSKTLKDLDAKDLELLGDVSKSVNLGSIEGLLSNPVSRKGAKNVGLRDKLKMLRTSKEYANAASGENKATAIRDLLARDLTPQQVQELAGSARGPLGSGLNQGLSSLALGGVIGGLGANVQYRKGQRQGEEKRKLMQQAGMKVASTMDLAQRVALEIIAENVS